MIDSPEDRATHVSHIRRSVWTGTTVHACFWPAGRGERNAVMCSGVVQRDLGPQFEQHGRIEITWNNLDVRAACVCVCVRVCVCMRTKCACMPALSRGRESDDISPRMHVPTSTPEHPTTSTHTHIRTYTTGECRLDTTTCLARTRRRLGTIHTSPRTSLDMSSRGRRRRSICRRRLCRTCTRLKLRPCTELYTRQWI